MENIPNLISSMKKKDIMTGGKRAILRSIIIEDFVGITIEETLGVSQVVICKKS